MEVFVSYRFCYVRHIVNLRSLLHNLHWCLHWHSYVVYGKLGDCLARRNQTCCLLGSGFDGAKERERLTATKEQ